MPFTDLVPLTVIAGFGFAYWAGLQRSHTRPAQRIFFASGLVVTAVAVASPLDGLVDRSLTAHMVQHVLLLCASGPLLALGAPLTLLWALPGSVRGRALRASRRLSRHHDRWQPAWVGGGLLLEGVVMVGWHLPWLYDAALRHPVLHDAEHLTFVLIATMAWWTIVTGRRSRRGATAVAALIGSLSGILLGSALVVAPHPLYAAYPSLSDQRMAGVVMWAFGGLLEDIVGAALFASWLHRPDEPRDIVVPPLPSGVR